ncbi:unnamed protein product [Pleuronectes platessa]|uniref:Uncharacterized protein n=1 Tax=Pleuronectes platessa TaxID=8262 RepID=A0A9N7U1K5_PLEPL|nr:unnamed protein product [Pleuronectes platessa]
MHLGTEPGGGVRSGLDGVWLNNSSIQVSKHNLRPTSSVCFGGSRSIGDGRDEDERDAHCDTSSLKIRISCEAADGAKSPALIQVQCRTSRKLEPGSERECELPPPTSPLAALESPGS